MVNQIYEEKQDDEITVQPSPSSTQLHLNVSGHAQEVDRSFSFLSICAFAIAVDGAWIVGAGSLVVALYNGGGPGVLYELLCASFFYLLICTALAELASAIPSSASVYHWASVTAGPRWGRVCSFYAGWWNMLAWTTGCAGGTLIFANVILAMWSVHHPEYEPQQWQTFVVYMIIQWSVCLVVAFCQRQLPTIASIAGGATVLAWIISMILVTVFTSRNGRGFATSSFVWKDWNNLTGWSSNGLVFLAGTLNGSWTIGTPDAASHMAEEVPRPRKNIPRAMFIFLAIGTVTSFLYYMVLLYAINDLDAVQSSPFTTLPLATIFQQAAGSNSGTLVLLALILIPGCMNQPGVYMTATRVLWTLGRDQALPFSSWIGRTDVKHKNPFNAALTLGCINTCYGLIYLGSKTAFNAIIGSFVVLTTLSYLAAILPNLLTARKYVRPGTFWMGRWTANLIMGVSCAYIVSFNFVYLFPFALPVDASTMNYTSVICGGCTLLITPWYMWKRRHGYEGPIVLQDAPDDIRTGTVLSGELLEKDRKGLLADKSRAEAMR